MIKRLMLAFGLIAITNDGWAEQFPTLADKPPPSFNVEEFGTTYGATDVARALPLPKLAFGLIKDFEGWIPFAYNDPVGLCTIGYGHLIRKKRCETIVPVLQQLGFDKPITEAKGSTLLDEDSVGARLTVQNMVKVDLTDGQFGALSSFTFNVGPKAFAGSTLLKVLNAGDYSSAQQQFSRWVKAKGNVFSGLITRRACEAAMFSGDLPATSDKPFNRQSCVSFGATALPGDLIDIEVGE